MAGEHRDQPLLQLALPEQVPEQRAEQRVERRLPGAGDDRDHVVAGVRRDLAEPS